MTLEGFSDPAIQYPLNCPELWKDFKMSHSSVISQSSAVEEVSINA